MGSHGVKVIESALVSKGCWFGSLDMQDNVWVGGVNTKTDAMMRRINDLVVTAGPRDDVCNSSASL